MLKTTTVGSFPRKDKQKDTLRKSTVTDQEAFEMIDKGLLYMKIVKSDRSEYEPHF